MAGSDAFPVKEHADGSWSQNGGHLERRWLLWQDFMKEQAHLDTWLHLAECDVTSFSSFSSAPLTYAAATENLRKFERLQCEAGFRLVQLDGLTRRNRTLLRLFDGAMRARLLAAARDCGQRWDEINAKLETITARLKVFVSEWEEFEAERAELDLWLVDLEVRLMEGQLTGSSCDRLRQLQSLQQCVCVNSERVNTLLRRGEALIQRSEAKDAERVEDKMLHLLRRCSSIDSSITKTHTHLLSMRLVFEEEFIFFPSSDSGCPSESFFEEDAGASCDPPPPAHLAPPPPSPSPPSHDPLGLEWDPSVDIGRSVSHDDDSSHFSASTGVYHRDGVRRRSFFGSYSDISDDNEEVNPRLDGWFGHAPSAAGCRANSSPGNRRVRAWLQSPAPLETGTSCSRAVQTDSQAEEEEEEEEENEEENEEEEEENKKEEASGEEERLLSEHSRPSSSFLLPPVLLCLFLAAALTFLLFFTWMATEPTWHRGFHLTLNYVNGPPPT